MTNRTGAASGLAISLMLAGCGPLGLQLGQLFGGSPSKTPVSSSSAGSSSQDAPPFQPAANQLALVSAGILDKNSSKLEGTLLGPAGILDKNSSKFQVESLGQVPLAGAWVYLWTTDGLYLADPDGKPYEAKTDSSGNFSFSEPVPGGQEYVLDARSYFGSSYYYLANFAFTQSGQTNVNIDLASTCASDYLKRQSQIWSRPLGQLDFSKLPAIITATRGLLDSGALTIGLDELLVLNIDQLVSTYGAVSARDATLAAQWNAFLGPAPSASPAPTPMGATNTASPNPGESPP